MLSIALELFHKNIVLLVHDGFVCRNRLDQDQQGVLIETIRDVTGYVMGLDETQLRAETDNVDVGLSQ